MLPKCPICKTNYITSKSRNFAKNEGLSSDICIYCLAKKTGKRIGRTGMVEEKNFTPDKAPSSGGVKTPSYQRSIAQCRPCLERRLGRRS